MRLPSLQHPGSPRRIFALAAPVIFAALAAGLTGCGDGGHDHGDWSGGGDQGGGSDTTITANPEKVAIDTGATINATPGGGVGVFVQYATGGHWTVNTACDTNTSQLSCGFDLFVGAVGSTTAQNGDGNGNGAPSGANTAGTIVSNVQTLDPNGDPIGFEIDQGTLHVSTNTSVNLDGVTFDAPAGTTIELEVYLDQVPQPRFVYWIGDKVLHTGAPTDPIDLAPTAM